MSVPEEDAPVLPEVPELLEVPAVPPDEGIPLVVEPEDDPIPDDEPEVVPVLLGALPDEEGATADEPDDVSEGATLPDADPVAEPMPDVDPDIVPLAPGPEVVHALSASAQVRGNIHLIMMTP